MSDEIKETESMQDSDEQTIKDIIKNLTGEENETQAEESNDDMNMAGLARGVAKLLEEQTEEQEAKEDEQTSEAQSLAKNLLDDECSQTSEDSSEIEISSQNESLVESADCSAGFELRPIVEAILFVNEKPVSPSDIAKTLELDRKAIDDTIRELQSEYDSNNGGLRIIKVAGGYQMRTSGETVEWVKKLYRNKFKRKLSNSALEVLAIIAYKQPITKMELEAIRGVDCDGVVRSLLNMGLIKLKGRKDVIGRPFLYGTSDAFLEHFGLNSLNEMPKLEIDGAALALSQAGENTESSELTDNASDDEPKENNNEKKQDETEIVDVEATVVEKEEQSDGS